MDIDITVDIVGRRHYFRGNTYPVKDKLRAAGAHWDADQKAWWVGRRDVAEKVLAEIGPKSGPKVESTEKSDSTPPSSDRPAEALRDADTVRGRARYKGKEYLLLWDGNTKRGYAAKLAFTDGSRVFWADGEAIQITKIYETREWRGQKQPMTFGKLRRLREEYAAEKKQDRELAKTDGVVGARGAYEVQFEGNKHDRSPQKALGTASWLRHRKELIAVVLVGYEPARYVRSEDAEDMGHYDMRSGYYGVEHYRAATVEEYEALQQRSPRAEGTCVGLDADPEVVADIKERAAAEQGLKAAREALPKWIVGQVRRPENYVSDPTAKITPGAWAYHLGLRAAGSETLYFAPGEVWYVESSYDDGPRTWHLTLTDGQIAAVGQMLRVLSSCTRHRDCRTDLGLAVACSEAA